jgi:GntR family transcriptional regulator
MNVNTDKFSELKLDKNLPIPLYYQVEKYIRDLIGKGDLKPGYKIPTEIEFMNTLNISRTTIRKATNNLLRDNLIEIKKGQGTFIKNKQFYEPVFGIISYAEEALKQGFIPATKILDLNIIKASEEISGILKLPKNSPVYRIKRLRLLNGNAIGIDNTFLPAKYVPKLTKEDFEEYGIKQSLYHLLENKYGLVLDIAEENFTATLTTKKDAELLGMKSKVPILLRKRTVFLPDKSPLLFMESSYKSSLKTVLKGK